MNEPTRWLDGNAPSGALPLMRAGFDESPSKRCLESTLAAVSASAIGLSVATTAHAATLSTTTKAASTSLPLFFGKVVAVSLFAGGCVLGTVAAVQHYRSAPSVAQVAQTHRAAVVPRASLPKAITELGPSPEVPSASELPLVTELPNRPGSKLTAVRPHVPADAFAEEVAYLDRMRSQLRAGDAKGTLDRVAEYENTARFGHFVPETLYLRMEAYRTLGNQAAATTTAQDIVRRFPRSAQARRAGALLESDGSVTRELE